MRHTGVISVGAGGLPRRAEDISNFQAFNLFRIELTKLIVRVIVVTKYGEELS